LIDALPQHVTRDNRDTVTEQLQEILSLYTSLTIRNTDPNTPTADRIEVATSYDANITLAGVNIDVSDTSGTAALLIKTNQWGQSSFNITLADGSMNILKSGANCAGLQNEHDLQAVVIKGGGSLTATGGAGGAGISSTDTVTSHRTTTSSGGLNIAPSRGHNTRTH